MQHGFGRVMLASRESEGRMMSRFRWLRRWPGQDFKPEQLSVDHDESIAVWNQLLAKAAELRRQADQALIEDPHSKETKELCASAAGVEKQLRKLRDLMQDMGISLPAPDSKP
jgi:hypothetical protein